jgi:hypothetical protein
MDLTFDCQNLSLADTYTTPKPIASQFMYHAKTYRLPIPIHHAKTYRMSIRILHQNLSLANTYTTAKLSLANTCTTPKPIASQYR